MKSRKRMFAWILVLCLSLASCQQSAPAQPEEQIAPTDPPAGEQPAGEQAPALYFPEKNENNVDIGELMQFSGDVFAPSAVDLYERADLVIVGTVTAELSSESDVTLSEVLVDEVWKGNCAPGDDLTVREMGARYEDHDASLWKVPLLREGARVVLLLEQEQDGARGICGGCQGKCFIDGQGLAYPYSYYVDDSDLPGAAFAEFTHSMSPDILLPLLRGMLLTD